jgi:hypothetical protein
MACASYKAAVAGGNGSSLPRRHERDLSLRGGKQ